MDKTTLLNLALPLFLSAVPIGSMMAQERNTVQFSGNFKDAIITYSSGGNRVSVNATELPDKDNCESLASPVISVGDIVITQSKNSEVFLFWDAETESLGILNNKKVNNGSYNIEVLQNNIVWVLTVADDPTAGFNSLTLTAPMGMSPSAPLSQYGNNNTNFGRPTLKDNVYSTKPYNSKLWTSIKLLDMGVKGSDGDSAVGKASFAWSDISVEYTTEKGLGLDNFSKARALDDGKEFTYIGEAVVTWYDRANKNLWMRDAQNPGVGMYFKDCPDLGADVGQGSVLKGTFKATHHSDIKANRHTGQIYCVIDASTVPSFVGYTYIEPRIVNDRTQEYFASTAADAINIGQFLEDDMCDYVKITGVFKNSHNEDNEYPPLSRSMLVNPDRWYIVVGLSEDRNNPRISNALDFTKYNSVKDGVTYWIPTDGTSRSSSGDYYPQTTDPEWAGREVTAYGLAMDVGRGVQMWPLFLSTDPDGTTAIETITPETETADTHPAAYYTIGGQLIQGQPAPGLYIVISGDGKVSKQIIR